LFVLKTPSSFLKALISLEEIRHDLPSAIRLTTSAADLRKYFGKYRNPGFNKKHILVTNTVAI
jgi:hypothetical protein